MSGLEVGDVVMLKSGGPRMTVLFISQQSDKPSRIVKCAWFNGSANHDAEFAYASLKKLQDQ